MPNYPPRLDVQNQSPQGQLFDAAVGVFRNDPGLQGIGANIRTYDDGPDDIPPRTEYPDVTLCPYVFIGLGQGGIRAVKKTINTYGGILNLTFELYIAGYSQRDLFNFGHAIFLAWYPDQSNRALIRQTLQSQGAGADRIGFNGAGISIVGKSQHGLKGGMSLTVEQIITFQY